MRGYIEDAEWVYRIAEGTRRYLLRLSQLGTLAFCIAAFIALLVDFETSIILYLAALAGRLMTSIIRNWHETPPVKSLIREITLERLRFDEFYAEYRKIRSGSR